MPRKVKLKDFKKGDYIKINVDNWIALDDIDGVSSSGKKVTLKMKGGKKEEFDCDLADHVKTVLKSKGKGDA